MPKTGKSDAHWRQLLQEYAAGTFLFTTGKKPGAKKWKAELKKIDDCPLQGSTVTVDLFKNPIKCRCGYQKQKQPIPKLEQQHH